MSRFVSSPGPAPMSASTQAGSLGLLLPLESRLLPGATTNPDGTGLGLFVVQTTVESHGGGLRCSRSAELGGVEVRLELPLPAAAETV